MSVLMADQGWPPRLSSVVDVRLSERLVRLRVRRREGEVGDCTVCMHRTIHSVWGEGRCAVDWVGVACGDAV